MIELKNNIKTIHQERPLTRDSKTLCFRLSSNTAPNITPTSQGKNRKCVESYVLLITPGRLHEKKNEDFKDSYQHKHTSYCWCNPSLCMLQICIQCPTTKLSIARIWSSNGIDKCHRQRMVRWKIAEYPRLNTKSVGDTVVRNSHQFKTGVVKRSNSIQICSLPFVVDPHNSVCRVLFSTSFFHNCQQDNGT